MNGSSLPKDECCWSCQVNPATEPFQYGGRETKVCERCCRWLRARDELDAILRDELTSESVENTNEFLDRLNRFSIDHQHLDDTGEFSRKVAHHRVLALVDAHRYAEAEVACDVWKNLGFGTTWERWEHGYESARIAMALQKPDKAFRTLDEALRHHDQYFLGIGEKLEFLVELGQLLGESVQPEHLELSRKVADAYGLQLDHALAPAEMIRKLAKSIQDKLPLQN